MAAAAWIKAHGLWKVDDIVPQKTAPEHVASVSNGSVFGPFLL